MSNAFSGQRQFAQSPMMGGYGGGYGGGMGGYGSPFGGGMGGYGTQFGGYDMGGGFGGFGGYQQPSLMPSYQPTINDAFSNYFSQQYYGGNAFNPFAATSMFGGGGYGGGFGGRGGRGGRRGGGRQLRQMFEDYFQPEQPLEAQRMPGLQPREPMMYAGGNPNFDMTGARDPGSQPGLQPGVMPPPAPPATAAQLQQAGVSSSGMGPGTWSQMPSDQKQRYLQNGGTAPPQRIEEFPGVQPSPFAPQPYMGGFPFPFDQTLPAKSEAPTAPAAQGFDSIMPVQQDTPVQSAPMAPTFYEPPPPAPTFYAPPPPAQTLYEPPPPAPTFYEPPVMAPFVPSFEPAVFEPQPYIPPMQTYAPEPMPFVPEPIRSPFSRPSRDMFMDDFGFGMR